MAEVLITLGIIGVVAAVTMPTLIQNHKRHTTVNRLKKSYSTIAQAFTRAQADYGDSNIWDNLNITSSDYMPIVAENVEKYILPYLENVLFAGLATLKDRGYTQYVNILGNTNTNLSNVTSKKYIIEVADGTTYFFTKESSNYMLIYIDINGRKGPNVWGRDAFMFQLTKNGVFQELYRGQYTNRDNLKNNCGLKTTGGQLCSTLIIFDGWQIKDDYPVKL